MSGNNYENAKGENEDKFSAFVWVMFPMAKKYVLGWKHTVTWSENYLKSDYISTTN